jgi:methylthioribose-1-phosphate isomerase
MAGTLRGEVQEGDVRSRPGGSQRGCGEQDRHLHALAARASDVPAYALFRIDLSLARSLIPIEERDPAEVLEIQARGEQVVPAGARARNPAFDITPNALISAIVTENGIVRPPYTESLPRISAA